MKYVIMLHGLPGSGKSFVASRIQSVFPRSVVLKSITRRKVSGFGVVLFDESCPQTREDKDESYHALCSDARAVIERGGIPVLDATFHKQYRREWVYGLADSLGAKVIVIDVVCPERIIVGRLKRRSGEQGEDAFLNSVDSYNIMKSQNEPIDEDVLVKTVRSDDELIPWLKSIIE